MKYSFHIFFVALFFFLQSGFDNAKNCLAEGKKQRQNDISIGIDGDENIQSEIIQSRKESKKSNSKDKKKSKKSKKSKKNKTKSDQVEPSKSKSKKSPKTTKDSISNEVNDQYQLCMKMKNELYEDTTLIDQTLLEWESFLPVILKKDLARFNSLPSKYYTKIHEQEIVANKQRFNYLGPIGPSCKESLEVYGQGDEEKRVCSLSTVQYLNTIGGECVVYSIGSENRWEFEESIFEETNCRVETFDCTIPSTTLPPSDIRSRVRFHHLCLSDRDYEVDGRKYVSWSSLNEIVGLPADSSPTLLKMDIEGYEFPVMRSIINSGSNIPLQIALELHLIRWERGEPQFDRSVPTSELMSFMNYLRKFGGYYLINRYDNPYCLSCSEVLLAKLNCDSIKSNRTMSNLLKQTHPTFRELIEYSLEGQYYE